MEKNQGLDLELVFFSPEFLNYSGIVEKLFSVAIRNGGVLLKVEFTLAFTAHLTHRGWLGMLL